MKNESTTAKTLTLNIITTHADGNITVEKRAGVDLVSAYSALESIARENQRKIQIDIRNGGAALDVYSLLRAALHIAVNSSKNAADPTLQVAHAGLSTISARLSLPEYIDGGAELLMALVNGDIGRGVSAEAKDIYSNAYNGIFDAYAADTAANNAELYSAGYAAVNGYLNRERRDHSREVSAEWIHANGGELVKESDYKARIIYGGERYTPAPEYSAYISVDTRAVIAKAISESSATLTAPQKKALELSEKNSYKQIADAMHISKSTAADHVSAARAKTADYIARNYPELLEIVDALPLIEKARAMSERKHKTESAANYNDAMESARYTYGKHYTAKESADFSAAAADIQADINAARIEYAAAVAAVESVRAAAGVNGVQIARAIWYLKHDFGKFAAADTIARERIAAAYRIAAAEVSARKAREVVEAHEKRLELLRKPRKKPAKKSRKNSEKSPAAPLVKVTI